MPSPLFLFMLLVEPTYQFTFNQVVMLAGVLITIGGNYWLLLNLRKENTEIKKEVINQGKEVASMRSDVTNLQHSNERIWDKLNSK